MSNLKSFCYVLLCSILIFSCNPDLKSGKISDPIIELAAGSYTVAQITKITCETPEAIIYYSVDGSEPASSSLRYSGPVSINSSTTLKAKAILSAKIESQTISVQYFIGQKIEIPAANINEGIYEGAQTITLACPTDGVSIHYTTNGIEPTLDSPEYTEPISISTTCTLKVRAYKNGCIESDIITINYTISGTIAVPTLSDGYATYTKAQKIIISCATPEASIHYTLDGTDPTEGSPLYESPVEVSKTLILKAKAYKSGWQTSSISKAEYTITGTAAVPVFNISSGTFASSVSVEITCATPGATIYYTTDGKDPTNFSTKYNSAINISSTTTIKARAYIRFWNKSECAEGIFSIQFTDMPSATSQLSVNGITLKIKLDFSSRVSVAGTITARVYNKGDSPSKPGSVLLAEKSAVAIPNQDCIFSCEQTLETSTTTLETDKLYDIYFSINDSQTELIYPTQINITSPHEPQFDASAAGRYKFHTYEADTKISNGLLEGTGSIFYPDNNTKGPYPVVLITHGWMSDKSYFVYLGEHGASHGYIVMTFSVVDDDLPSKWPPCFVAARKVLIEENTRVGSPVKGKINIDKLNIIGHSMGGAGVLHAANNELRNSIKSVIGINPYNGGAPIPIPNDLGGNLENTLVPAMIILAQNDELATPKLSYNFFTSMKQKPKLVMCMKSMTHGDVGPGYAGYNEKYTPYYKKFILSWLNVYSENDLRYNIYFDGNEHNTDLSNDMFDGNVVSGDVPDYIYIQ